MVDRILTGFHAIEEYILSVSHGNGLDKSSAQLFYASPGPRVKKILAAAKNAAISCTETDKSKLDSMVASLTEPAREHRGVVLRLSGTAEESNVVDFFSWLKKIPDAAIVIILDSVTDPHNVGAILRSCDQFGVDLVVLPERRGVKDATANEVVSRASAGASAWVPVSVVPNLSRVVQLLKDNGFWVYGADAGGTPVTQQEFPVRTALVMGSEGNGISRLLGEQCDAIVSIPTCGRLDSLNVSVATGVLLYEIQRQRLVQGE